MVYGECRNAVLDHSFFELFQDPVPGRRAPNMKSRKIILLGAVALMVLITNIAIAQDLLANKCEELVRMADTYQQDFKTVDTVLGSAIDSGDMDRIRSYKLKKGMVKKQLDSVLQAIDLKGCARAR
jgi:hypothetical protein